jgi:hypothetical protein
MRVGDPMNRTRLALLLAAVALALHLPAWSPWVTWSHWGEDGPELEGALRTLGVPHPTGYPLFLLLGRVLALGLPLPWSAANLLSLLAAVGAGAGVGLAGAALAKRVRPGHPREATANGFLAGTLFMLSFTWMGQAAIGEVYTLHLALAAWALALLLERGPRPRLLAAYLLGLGLAHHRLTVPLVGLVLLYRFLEGDRRPRPATVAVFLLPLTLYLVLPIRSRFDPPFDWGDPEGLRSLWATVSGAPYRGYLLQDGVGAWLARAGRSLRYLPAAQLGGVGAALALVGLAVTWRRAPREGVLLTGLLLGSVLVAAAYAIPDPAPYYLPAIFGLALAAGVGGAFLLERVLALRGGVLRSAAAAALLAALTAGISLPAARNAARTEARDESAFLYAVEGTAALLPGALVISHGDGRTFSLWYGVHVLSPRPDVVVLYDNLLDWPWYRSYLAERCPEVQLPAPGTPREASWRLLVERNLARRPIYVTEPEPSLPLRYGILGAGPLYRVTEANLTARASSERPGTAPRRPAAEARTAPTHR